MRLGTKAVARGRVRMGLGAVLRRLTKSLASEEHVKTLCCVFGAASGWILGVRAWMLGDWIGGCWNGPEKR